MKVLSVSVFLIVIILAEVKADIKKISGECYVESKALPEEVTKVVKSGFQTPASEPVKCFFKCILEKCGHFKSGKLDDTAVVNSLEKFPPLKDHKESLTLAIKECKDEKGANDCDTVFKMIKCFYAHKAGEIVFTEYLTKT